MLRLELQRGNVDSVLRIRIQSVIVGIYFFIQTLGLIFELWKTQINPNVNTVKLMLQFATNLELK